MTSLPSYHEATARPNWLRLVAPYVSHRDYPALCLVAKQFWDVFAPRIWVNVLRAVRLAGLRTGDDLHWWFSFAFAHLERTEPKSRNLVSVLDARAFAKDSYHFALDKHDATLNQSFKRALSLLPKLTCILLDGHAELDTGTILADADPKETGRGELLLLSVADCPSPLPSTFFSYPRVSGLVYLDVSGIPGSVWPMLQPSVLADLRILKIRSREMDDLAFVTLAVRFGTRLWSLDISDNRLSDAIVDDMAARCFSASDLRSEAYFRVEGKLAPSQGGFPGYGSFAFVDESEWSASFTHPERFFIDAPMYMALPGSGPQEYQAFRSDGRDRIKPDCADAMLRALSGEDPYLDVESYRGCLGLTHMKLSNNQISSFGIESLLRNSKGHLEELACDCMPLVGASEDECRIWPKSARLYGILNAAHFLRPVFSSNLRILRLHHSVVTGIPTLEMKHLSTMSRLYIAETSILTRSKLAYPQLFVPDMNPRLISLTLTHIPRRSSGPLIAMLVQFLKLLSSQEEAIFDAKTASSSWKRPEMLEGLRHLRLEFEPDPRDDLFSMEEDLGAEELMNTGEKGFSFFDDSTSVQPLEQPLQQVGDLEVKCSSGAENDQNDESDRVEGEFLTHKGEWNAEAFSVPVWIGPKTPSGSIVINDYRRLVLRYGIRGMVGPCTPGQVTAGAPDRSYLFQTAWCMAIMPAELAAPPRSELMAMRDVLEELKRFRLAGRSRYTELKRRAKGEQVAPGVPHHFWTGRVEVARADPLPQSRPSQYWR